MVVLEAFLPSSSSTQQNDASTKQAQAQVLYHCFFPTKVQSQGEDKEEVVLLLNAVLHKAFHSLPSRISSTIVIPLTNATGTDGGSDGIVSEASLALLRALLIATDISILVTPGAFPSSRTTALMGGKNGRKQPNHGMESLLPSPCTSSFPSTPR